MSGIVVRVALHERHHRHARLEAREAQRQLRKQPERDHDHHQRIAVLGQEAGLPLRDVARVSQQLEDPGSDDDDIQREINHDDADGEADGFAEPFEKHCSEKRQQHQRDGYRMVQHCRHERVVHDMFGRVGG